jgi:hypothetical protein
MESGLVAAFQQGQSESPQILEATIPGLEMLVGASPKFGVD